MAGGRVRDTTIRGAAGAAGGAGTVGVASVMPCAGKRDRTGHEFPGLPQRHVHRPVGAALFGELPGAVERVDDPHPPRGEPHRIVDALFGEHGIVGPFGRQRRHQEVVGPLVAGGLAVLGARRGEFGAHVEQQGTRLGGQPRGQFVIGHFCSRLSSNSITASASSSRVRSGVSRRSAFLGRWYGLSIPVKWVISPARALA